MGHSVQLLSADEVARLCAEEERDYRANGASGRHCFELFRRAFDEGDEHAMILLRRQYDPQIGKWVRRFASHPLNPTQVQNRIDETLARFWYTHRDVLLEVKFAGIGRVLAFMRLTTRAAVLDWQARRQKGAPDEELFSTNGYTPEPMTTSPVDKEAFWEQVKAVLNDRREAIVVEEMFFFDRKPAAIASSYPQEFPQVKDVYRTYENVKRRLQRRLDGSELGDLIGVTVAQKQAGS